MISIGKYTDYVILIIDISIININGGHQMARKEFETLTPQMYYILLVLHVPRHGYEIMSEISRLTDEKIKIGAGTLYTLLPRFENEGYIRLIKEENKRKIYQLTKTGQRKLKEEQDRLTMQLQHYKEVFEHEEV